MAKKLRTTDLNKIKEDGAKISALTAYDYTMASLLDRAGVDLVLVGDSLGMVVQGFETTLPVTLDEMIYHSKMVVRAVSRAIVVADMPFMSYQLGEKEALASAGRLLKEAGVEAVKLEGGGVEAGYIKKIVEAGIPVLGHVGLKPQSVHQMGGYKVQGKTEEEATEVVAQALAVQDAGAFAIVLEGLPAELAEKITGMLKIPTIGIGAGAGCDGQILVTNDMLGLSAESSELSPKFVRRYADLSSEISKSVTNYIQDVKQSKFPSLNESYSSKHKAFKPTLVSNKK